MREHLFRAKRVDNGEWVEGSLIYGNKINPNGDTKTVECVYICWAFYDSIKCYAEVVPETVGEFTGLCDKNGKRIFEGDIVRRQTFGEMTEKYQNQKEFNKHKKRIVKGCGCIFDTETKYHSNYDYVVVWELNGFYPFCDSPENCRHCGGAEDNSECEVIGNIHDNKELLEVEE